jgi:DNA-binding GntR family transcriptional regulator
MRSVDTLSTKADDIALEIEQAILAGELEPGAVLRQEQLSERFAVSRTPVREALRQLAALGLVSFVPNRGVRVRSLSRDDLREAFLVRAELEGLAAELATPRMGEPELRELETAESGFARLTHVLRTGDFAAADFPALTAEWVHANDAFHDVVLRSAGAPLLERMARSVRRVFHGQSVWATETKVDALYEENLRQHRAIREGRANPSQRARPVLRTPARGDPGRARRAPRRRRFRIRDRGESPRIGHNGR